jgi:hypothetical protein
MIAQKASNPGPTFIILSAKEWSLSAQSWMSIRRPAVIGKHSSIVTKV